MESIDKIHGTFEHRSSETVKNTVVPTAVIKRLPRYHRYLADLLESGKKRISSSELSEIMNVTASQIRQDLNCFGGFGQQGYGYNVNYLYSKICEILGVSFGFRAALVGAGNLGMALVKSPMFEKRGVDVVAMFDVNEEIIGKKVSGISVYSMDELEKKLDDSKESTLKKLEISHKLQEYEELKKTVENIPPEILGAYKNRGKISSQIQSEKVLLQFSLLMIL